MFVIYVVILGHCGINGNIYTFFTFILSKILQGHTFFRDIVIICKVSAEKTHFDQQNIFFRFFLDICYVDIIFASAPLHKYICDYVILL